MHFFPFKDFHPVIFYPTLSLSRATFFRCCALIQDILLQSVEMFKNMIEDKSSYTKGKEIIPRGKLENIAVKLYGSQYESAHPTSSTTDNDGIFTPWFQTRGKAFKVKRYHYIDGGANAANTGSFSDQTVDVAVLTLYERLVTTYFNQLPLSLPDVFDRLEWVKHKRDKLTSKYP